MAKTGTFVQYPLDQEGKTPYVVTPHNRLPVEETGYGVARGQIPGAKNITSYGKRVADGAETNRIVWPNGIFTLPPAAGVQMSIASTSANDDIAGTHIRKVEIHYLDASLIEKHETIELDGTTPVLTTATDIRFIDCMHIQEYGTTAYADGDITASNGGTIYSQISAGEVRCTSSARMVPKDKVCYVSGMIIGAVSGSSAARVFVQLVATELDENQYIDPLIFLPHAGAGMQDTSVNFAFSVPFKFLEGSVIGLSMTTDKGATVGGSWFGWLENA